MAVTDRLKGQASSTVVISEPGGTLQGRSLAIQGTLRLHAGEELIVFLYRTPIGYWRNVGFGQGCFRVANNRVQAEPSDVELTQDTPASSGTPLSALHGLKATEFKTRVRALITK